MGDEDWEHLKGDDARSVYRNSLIMIPIVVFLGALVIAGRDHLSIGTIILAMVLLFIWYVLMILTWGARMERANKLDRTVRKSIPVPIAEAAQQVKQTLVQQGYGFECVDHNIDRAVALKPYRAEYRIPPGKEDIVISLGWLDGDTTEVQVTIADHYVGKPDRLLDELSGALGGEGP